MAMPRLFVVIMPIVMVGVRVAMVMVVGGGIVVRLSRRVRMLVRVLELAVAMDMGVAHDSRHGPRVPWRRLGSARTWVDTAVASV